MVNTINHEYPSPNRAPDSVNIEEQPSNILQQTTSPSSSSPPALSTVQTARSALTPPPSITPVQAATLPPPTSSNLVVITTTIAPIPQPVPPHIPTLAFTAQTFTQQTTNTTSIPRVTQFGSMPPFTFPLDNVAFTQWLYKLQYSLQRTNDSNNGHTTQNTNHLHRQQPDQPPNQTTRHQPETTAADTHIVPTPSSQHLEKSNTSSNYIRP